MDLPTASTLQQIGGFSLKGPTFVKSGSTSSTQWSTTIATLVGAVGAHDRSLWNNCKVADWLSEWTGEQIGRHLNLDINFLFMSGIPKTTHIFQEKLNFVKLGCALDKCILISNIFKKADFLVDLNPS